MGSRVGGRRLGRPSRDALLALAGSGIGFVLGLLWGHLMIMPLLGTAGILLVLLAAQVGTLAWPRGGARRHWRGAALGAADSWDELRRELDRSRRLDHQFALVRIGLRDLQAAGMSESGEEVVRHLRSHDRAWIDQASFYVLLPESGTESAVTTIARINTALNSQLNASIVSFPKDGYTSEALLARLHGYRVLGSFEVEEVGVAARYRLRRRRPRPSGAAVADHERRVG